MIKLNTLFELKKHPPVPDVVYVRSIKKLYRNFDGEWIERAYYTIKDVADIFNISIRKAQHILRRAGINNKVMSLGNLNYDQLAVLAKVIKMRNDNPCMKYSEIKTKLKI